MLLRMMTMLLSHVGGSVGIISIMVVDIGEGPSRLTGKVCYRESVRVCRVREMIRDLIITAYCVEHKFE